MYVDLKYKIFYITQMNDCVIALLSATAEI